MTRTHEMCRAPSLASRPVFSRTPGGQADEMLSRGFKDQIYDIFKALPPSVQVRALRRDGKPRRFLGADGTFD